MGGLTMLGWEMRRRRNSLQNCYLNILISRLWILLLGEGGELMRETRVLRIMTFFWNQETCERKYFGLPVKETFLRTMSTHF